MKKSFFGRLKISVLCILVLSCLCFGSCAPRARLDLLSSGFSCELRIVKDELELFAVAELGEASSLNGKTMASLQITAPQELSGMELSFDGRAFSLSFDGIALSSAAALRYLYFLKLLETGGGLTYRSSVRLDDKECLLYISNVSGCRWYFDKTGGMPVLVEAEGGETKLYILSIEPK